MVHTTPSNVAMAEWRLAATLCTVRFASAGSGTALSPAVAHRGIEHVR